MTMVRGILFAALLGVALGAGAQSYPARPVSIVVAFSAGGPTDSIARILAARMSGAFRQTVVVENTTGAGGTIGVGRVVKAAPDGYMLGIGHIGTHVVNGAIYPLSYDLQTDLEPVAMIATNPQILVAKNAIPAKNLREFLAWGKANADKGVGVGGVGGYCVQIARAFGAKVVAVDVDAARLAAVAEHGAALTLNAREHDAKAIKGAIAAFAKAQGVRATEWIVFECSGTAAGQLTAWSLLVHGATLCVVGFTMDRVEIRLS